MLTKYFLEFLIFLLGQFFTIMSGIFPEWNYLDTLSTAITSLLGVSTQTTNFLYFMFGDFYHIAIIMVGFMIPFKYITVPVLSFVRKLVVWGG